MAAHEERKRMSRRQMSELESRGLTMIKGVRDG